MERAEPVFRSTRCLRMRGARRKCDRRPRPEAELLVTETDGERLAVGQRRWHGGRSGVNDALVPDRLSVHRKENSEQGALRQGR